MRTMSAPHIDVPAKGAIVVDDDSPLTTASNEVFRQHPRDDLGRSYNLNRNLMHDRIPVELTASSDDTLPVECCAPIRVVPAGSSLSLYPRESVRLRGSQSSFGNRGTMRRASNNGQPEHHESHLRGSGRVFR